MQKDFHWIFAKHTTVASIAWGPRIVGWKKPLRGTFILNIDNERRPTTGMASAGGVLRNERLSGSKESFSISACYCCCCCSMARSPELSFTRAGFLLLGLYITLHLKICYNLGLCVRVNIAWIMGLTTFSIP